MVCTSWNVVCIQSRIRQTLMRRPYKRGQSAYRMGELYSTSDQTRWKYHVVPWSQRLEQSNQKENLWYSRTLDDILPQLSKASAITLNDAKSGQWHVTLDLQSSLLTTFNTPWGTFWWLRLPFGLKVASGVFQERLDRVIRLLPAVIGIADDILTHGSMIKEHNCRVISLLETARLNSLTLNSKKIQFRSQDCKFFIHRLTSEGLKADSFKVSAITQMKYSETIQDLRSLLGMVNYFNRFDLTLSDLTEPLRRLCKQDVM